MKRLLPLYILAAIVALAVGYYLTVALPGYNRAKLALERDRFVAEEKDKQERAKAERVAQTRYGDCESAANELYWEYIKLNGKPVPGKAGVYVASQAHWDVAAKRKKIAIDECVKGAVLATPIATLPPGAESPTEWMLRQEAEAKAAKVKK